MKALEIFGLNGQVAIVTGAGAGIGRAIHGAHPARQPGRAQIAMAPHFSFGKRSNTPSKTSVARSASRRSGSACS
jgi:hypothetical protein